MAFPRRWQSLLALVLFLLCAWQYYHETIALQLPGMIDTPSDFLPYYRAAQHIVHGRSPFLSDGYIYPPLLAFLLTPLAELDYVTARRLPLATIPDSRGVPLMALLGTRLVGRLLDRLRVGRRRIRR